MQKRRNFRHRIKNVLLELFMKKKQFNTLYDAALAKYQADNSKFIIENIDNTSWNQLYVLNI